MTPLLAPLLESPAIRWFGDRLQLLDQRHLPFASEWLELHDADDTADAIRDMVVRGAPAIGISAAYGIALAARQLGERATGDSLAPAFAVLAASRPTAVNLFWALERLRACAETLQGKALVEALAREARQIHEDDLAMNLAMGEHGAGILPARACVYTHCNTGALATGGHGTALGIIRTAHQQGKLQQVYAGETRPWLQGSRLTAWELMNDGIPVTLVVDSAAAHLMATGAVNVVIVGADRITANGDTANKIGTLSLAILARHHGIPFIVAAPSSTVDLALPDGKHIQIEERDPSEVRAVQGHPVAPPDIQVRNPAFDVTPASLISSIVTERGVVQSPDTAAMARHMEQPNR